jgi:hypothetical protein
VKVFWINHKFPPYHPLKERESLGTRVILRWLKAGQVIISFSNNSLKRTCQSHGFPVKFIPQKDRDNPIKSLTAP